MIILNLFRKKLLGVMAFSLAAGMTFTGTMSAYTPLDYNSISAVEASASSELLSSATGNTRCKIYNNETETFNMNGRTYSQGVVMGDGSYNDGAEITFDVSNLSSVTFSLGHVDNTSSSSTEITIYLDGTVEDIITLTQNEPIVEGYSVNVSEASTMRIVRTGDYSKYALADISADSESVKTYTSPEYKTSASFVDSIYDSYRCEKYDGTNAENSFRMQGRTYSSGIVMGDGSYNDNAALSINVENVNNISMTLGHVDNSQLSNTEVSVYLDNVLEDRLVLTPNEPLQEYKLDVSGTSTLRIVRDGSYSKYALADICFDDVSPEITYQTPQYKTSSSFVKDIYNSYRTSVFDGSSSALSFNMNGRSYYQGIVMGDGSYNENAAFSLNVENLKTVSFDLGHVDNSSSDEAVFTVYLDNEPVDKFKLTQNQPIREDYSIDVSAAKVLRIERDGSYSQYALGNIETEELVPKNSYSIPEYKNSASFVGSLYDTYRTKTYDGISSAISFNMQGRTYYQGLILGDGSYNEGAAASFNVENLKTITFDLGHVDNSRTSSANLYIYLDGEQERTIELSYQKPIETITVDVSSAKTMRVYRDESYSQYALGNIIADELAPKNSYSVPEQESAKKLVASNYDSFRTEFYTDTDQFTKFTMNEQDYTLGFIMGDGSYNEGAGVSFNVEKLDAVTFSLGLISEKQNAEETLSIYKDGELSDEILLTPENIVKLKNYTIDTAGVSTIRFYKNKGYTKYGIVDLSVTPASQTPSTPVTTPAVTAAPPVSSVTSEAPVTTAVSSVTSEAPATSAVTSVTTAQTTNVVTTAAVTTTVQTPAGGSGDANGDGKITTSDVRCILQYLVGSYKLSDETLKAADVDGNGSVNSADALKLLRKIAGVTETE